MNKALFHNANPSEVRLGRVPFCCNRYSIGRASLMKEARRANAVVRLQNIVLIDLETMDKHFAEMAGN